MKGYRKPSGVYIEIDDATPVGTHLVQVALRPSANHVFADGWATAPLDPAICWRPKTAIELSAEKDAAWQEFLESPSGKVIKTIVLTGIDKGIWTLAELRTKYRLL